jgi:hypothetical protein
MNACRLNFASNITCDTTSTDLAMNDTRAPYICVNNVTGARCTNASECCKPGYGFSLDVQQCLCKY